MHTRSLAAFPHVACVQNYCKPSEMQNRGKLVFDFGIPEAPRDLFKITASRAKCKIGGNLFLILPYPRRRVIYPKLLQAERNAKSGETCF
jgi:hypothetical protein